MKCTFTPKHWLENSICHRVPLYTCVMNFWSSIEKNDTVMREAIPTDMRVATTLWFLATVAIALLVTCSVYRSQQFA